MGGAGAWAAGDRGSPPSCGPRRGPRSFGRDLSAWCAGCGGECAAAFRCPECPFRARMQYFPFLALEQPRRGNVKHWLYLNVVLLWCIAEGAGAGRPVAWWRHVLYAVKVCERKAEIPPPCKIDPAPIVA